MAKSKPKIDLVALRKIGWTLWDPIGLIGLFGKVDEHCVDEYDTYLVKAAGMLVNGSTIDECADYFSDIATNYMGLGEMGDNPGARQSAIETALAIKDYIDGLETLRDRVTQ